MKKIIICSILVILLCCGCSAKSTDEKIQTENINDKTIGKVPEDAEIFISKIDDNSVILNYEEIKKYNENIKSKTNTIYDLQNIKTISSEEIKKYINSYKIPTLPKYDGGIEITKSMLESILDNRNIDKIGENENIKKGIIVERSNLRAFPTDIHFYDKKDITDVDNIQESELHINTPVLILHESRDRKWYFVLTTTYVGWVKNTDVAIATDEDFEYFINNKSFGIIIEPIIEIGNVVLDMSVKLPYVSENNSGYQFVLPVKGNDDFVIKETIILPKDKVHIGYLPYTKRNLYIQAIKYEGINYSWGGMDRGVDCSSYVSNVYGTFGILFPRNTSSQKDSVGEIIYLNNKTEEEKNNILSKNFPALLYQPGHVMIYLGVNDGNHYIINASGSKGEVVLEKLSDTNYLKSIDRLVLVK